MGLKPHANPEKQEQRQKLPWVRVTSHPSQSARWMGHPLRPWFSKQKQIPFGNDNQKDKSEEQKEILAWNDNEETKRFG
jgi:hypothetical protein